MASDGKVRISTEWDSQKAVSEMSTFSKTAKTGLKTIGVLGKTAITTITGIGAGLSAATAVGVKYNAAMENYMASFETLLGDASKAQQHMEELKTFAAETPFEMPGIADASRTLLSFGVENEKVMPVLKQLGDVSLGNSEKFSALALVYGQVASQGKLMGQDLLQCINAGFNPLQIISERTGKSMAELKEEMSQGAISAEMVAQAFQWATEEGGMFYEGTQKLAQTFDGQISTLKDNAQDLMGDVVKPVSDSMTKELLPAAIETIEGLAKAYEEKGLEGLIDATGEAFGEAVAMAGTYIPKITKTSVEFIYAFIKGIEKNRGKIKTAVADTMRLMKQELLNLLPETVRKPVEETLDKLENSLKNGGLREGLEYGAELFGRFADASLDVAEVVLPIFADALDFCADNMDILLSLLGAYFTAMKGYTIVTKATKAVDGITAAWKAATAVVKAHETANRLTMVTMYGGTTLAQTAVALLTGKITLATAAQWAWNTALNANPIALVVGAVAALAGGIFLLSRNMEDEISSSEAMAESNRQLAESYTGVLEAAQEFEKGIENAGSIFDDFNDSIVISAEKQQELADSMDAVQQQITEITGTYVEERKNLTESEIQELDRLFEKLHEQAAAELEAQQAYQEATLERARLLAETHQGTAEEYAASSQMIINTAQQTREQVIEKANEQFNEELALLQLRLKNDETYTQAMYEAEALAAQQTYDNAIEMANKQCGDTLTILTEGYANEATALSEANAEISALKEEALLENENYNARKLELEQALKDELYNAQEGDFTRRSELINELITLEEEHEKKSADINARMSKAMDEEAQNQAGTLLDMSANTELYGGKMEKRTEKMTDTIIGYLESMPADAKQAAVDTMQGMLEGLESKETELYAKAESIANGVTGRLKKALEVNSPSKKARRIFRSVPEGGILGLEDEAQNLYQKAETIAENMLKKFSDRSFDVSGMVANMEKAVNSKSAQIYTGISAQNQIYEKEQENKEVFDYEKFADIIKDRFDGMGIDIDDREFARLVWEVS